MECVPEQEVVSKQYWRTSWKSNGCWNLRYRWKQEALLDDDIQALIDERLEARKTKNFALLVKRDTVIY